MAAHLGTVSTFFPELRRQTDRPDRLTYGGEVWAERLRGVSVWTWVRLLAFQAPVGAGEGL